MLPVIPLTLTDRFACIIGALCQVVARRVGLNTGINGPLARLAGPLIILIVSRLRRYAARFARHAASPAPIKAPRPPRARKRPPSPHRTPQNFAWLLRLVPETAPIASQLRHLLADPEMAALLAEAPGLRRTLRPLCRMLGIRQTALPQIALPPAPPAAPLIMSSLTPPTPPPIPPRPSTLVPGPSPNPA